MTKDVSPNLGGDSVVIDVLDVPSDEPLQKSGKLVVKMYDEVFYPVVSVGRRKNTDKNIEKKTVDDKKEDAVGQVEATEVEVDNELVDTVLTDTVKKVGEPVRTRSRFRLWGARLSTLVVSVVAVIAIVLVGLRLAGFRTFTVMSGSMEPNYPVGSMIYVKPVDYQRLKVGDVVSYVASDDKTVVTHRIVDIEVDENDASVRRFRTQGDANDSADGKLVHYKNVLGTPIIVIPYIGYFARNIQQPPGIYITLVVGTLLLAWTFLPDTLEGRRKLRARV